MTDDSTADEPPAKTRAESADNAADAATAHRGWRGPLTAFLTVVAAVSLVLGVTATWMRTTIMSTDAWVEAMAPLPENPEFQDLIAEEVATQVADLIDVQTRLGDRLGPVAGLLAGPVEDTTLKFVQRATDAVLDSPAFETIWIDVNRFAHEKAVRVLRGDAPNLQTVDGKVVFDLAPIINLVVADVSNNAAGLFGGQLDLPEITADQVGAATAQLTSALGIDLPADFGQVPVFDESALEQVQRPVRLLDDGVVALWVLFGLSFVGALVASQNRRRTVAVLGVVTAVVATLVWLVRSPIEDGIVGQIKSAPGQQAATIVIETALWRNLGRLIAGLLVVSLVSAAIAFVAGPSETARSIRRTVAGLFGGDGATQTPVSRFMRRHTAGFRIAGALAALLAMFSLPTLTWSWFFVIVIVLAAYEASWQFVVPDQAEEQPDRLGIAAGSSPG